MLRISGFGFTNASLCGFLGQLALYRPLKIPWPVTLVGAMHTHTLAGFHNFWVSNQRNDRLLLAENIQAISEPRDAVYDFVQLL